MADSFGANLKVGVLSVHEAGPEVRFVMGPEYFSPACVAGSRRVLDVQEFSESQDGRASAGRLESDAHSSSVISSGDLRKTVWVWPDMPAVSRGAKGSQSLPDVHKDAVNPQPVMLARHPDIATKNRALTRHG